MFEHRLSNEDLQFLQVFYSKLLRSVETRNRIGHDRDRALTMIQDNPDNKNAYALLAQCTRKEKVLLYAIEKSLERDEGKIRQVVSFVNAHYHEHDFKDAARAILDTIDTYRHEYHYIRDRLAKEDAFLEKKDPDLFMELHEIWRQEQEKEGELVKKTAGLNNAKSFCTRILQKYFHKDLKTAAELLATGAFVTGMSVGASKLAQHFAQQFDQTAADQFTSGFLIICAGAITLLTILTYTQTNRELIEIAENHISHLKVPVHKK